MNIIEAAKSMQAGAVVRRESAKDVQYELIDGNPHERFSSSGVAVRGWSIGTEEILATDWEIVTQG